MTQKMWRCPYCKQLIPVVDTYHDAVDHLLDVHLPVLLEEKPLILRDAKGTR